MKKTVLKKFSQPILKLHASFNEKNIHLINFNHIGCIKRLKVYVIGTFYPFIKKKAIALHFV